MLPFLASMVITTTGSALFVSRTGHYWGVLVVGPVYAVAPTCIVLLNIRSLDFAVLPVAFFSPFRNSLPRSSSSYIRFYMALASVRYLAPSFITTTLGPEQGRARRNDVAKHVCRT